ncbi:MAG TPA: hypothetical protein VGU70_22440 [Methylobacterium sp.]|jgi:hypothetical protein|nr:hypothetical protein [Methylobacterium sp.]
MTPNNPLRPLEDRLAEARDRIEFMRDQIILAQQHRRPHNHRWVTLAGEQVPIIEALFGDNKQMQMRLKLVVNRGERFSEAVAMPRSASLEDFEAALAGLRADCENVHRMFDGHGFQGTEEAA